MRRLFLFALPLLSACSSVSELSEVKVTDYISPYRIDVRQGNYVTQDMVAQLKPGLSQQQVRFILGTPLLVDSFHKDRWDYLYRLQPGRGDLQTRRLTVFFEEGKLVRVAGDVAGAVAGAASDLPEAAASSKVIEIAPDKDAVTVAKSGDKKSDSWFAWPSWPSWLWGAKDENTDVNSAAKANAPQAGAAKPTAAN